MSTTTSTLKNLLSTLHDGEEGFAHAAENAKNPRLKELFSKLSAQRTQFIAELEPELAREGEDPAKVGSSVRGSVHQAWIDLKAALTKGEGHSILAEAERGEDVAKEAYMDALADDELPASARAIIAKQAAAVQAAHDEVKALRDAGK